MLQHQCGRHPPFHQGQPSQILFLTHHTTFCRHLNCCASQQVVLQIRGALEGGSSLASPPGASAQVDVLLHLETHFGSTEIVLTKQQYERDACALSQRIASGEVEYQLQRAVMSVVSCLGSADLKTQETGRNMLNTIDKLERYVGI